MLRSIKEIAEDNMDNIKLAYLFKTGHTYGLDYMIGNKEYCGKGYGMKTLVAFMNFSKENFDPFTCCFIIDPSTDNPRAKHVHMKAGFEHIDDFVMMGDVSERGKRHHLLVENVHTL